MHVHTCYLPLKNAVLHAQVSYTLQKSAVAPSCITAQCALLLHSVAAASTVLEHHQTLAAWLADRFGSTSRAPLLSGPAPPKQ